MHYAALASGSRGNCHAFFDGERTLLIDAGLSLLQVRKRLEAVGLEADTVGAVAISHEHTDHISGLPVWLRRTDWCFLMTEATRRAVERIHRLQIPEARWLPLRAGHATDWEGWRILPFATPHDAEDPVAYRLERRGVRAALVTDLGQPTDLVADHCQELDLLVLEANHDVEMLREGEYPPLLKARILSRVGHLSNEAAADLVHRVAGPRLKALVLAHLSEQNNDPALARSVVAPILDPSGRTLLALAHQREPMRVTMSL